MQFNYVAYTQVQGVVKGRVDAENEYEAREEVLRRGFKLLEIKPMRQLPKIEEMFPSLFKVGTGDLVRLSRQLATMVVGGSSLQRSLEMLENESSNRVLSSGPHHQDSGEAKIRESTAGVSRKPSSDGKARGCSRKQLCGLTAWNT